MAATLELERLEPAGRTESQAQRWLRAHASTLRTTASFLVVAIAWELAGRSGRWPLLIAPLSEIWTRFLQLAASGELIKHITVSLNEFAFGFAIAAVVGIALGVGIASSQVTRTSATHGSRPCTRPPPLPSAR